jgi:DnaJ-class molecular chaperone
MDYYATLGLKRGATDADIKKAYRSLAMKHHPDRGGDEKRFKEISQAYEFLSDPEKRRIIDMGGDPKGQTRMGGGFGQGPFEFHYGTENLNDLFGNFGFSFGQRPMRRNKSLNIAVSMTLEDVLKGKDINAEINLPSGKNKIVNISIPPGIEEGQQIRYEGMGDNSMSDLRPGDLIVNIIIDKHPDFTRDGSSLICEKEISVWDAVLGTSLEIKTLDNKTLSINVPKGTQPDTVFSCRGEGLPNMRTRQRGNLLIKLKVIVPRNLNTEQELLVSKIKNGF